MDPSTLRKTDSDPDPVPAPALVPVPSRPEEERRRRVRQKLHSPVYATFNNAQAEKVVNLCELLDLHEEGFAVQTGERLEVNRALDLTLDLPETRNFIHGSGQVIWSDASGRTGVRFSNLPEYSQHVLREWLFANLLIACFDQAAGGPAKKTEPAKKAEQVSPHAEAGTSTPAPDLNDILAAIEALGREDIADRDTVFQLVTAQALRLTGASAAALAFRTDNSMTCRACAGEIAPPLGTPVDIKQGLSGECVRSGLIVACEDAENDSRVDREVCQSLGIGSILAAPIMSDLRVVGLLEVFSPQPRAFTKAHENVLARLVEALPKEQPERPLRQDSATGKLFAPSGADSLMQEVGGALVESTPAAEAEAQAPRLLDSSRRLYLGLMALAVAMVAMALGYVLAPVIGRHWSSASRQAAPQSVAAAGAQDVTSRTIDDSLEAVRKLAAAGDPDAQWRLGVRYHTGAGVLQDDSQAVQWFVRAAEQGHAGAQATLGAYYWAGRGVPQDLSRAYFWSALAFAQGDDTSKSRLEGLSSQMTRAQVAAARQQADNWIRQHNAAKPAKQ